MSVSKENPVDRSIYNSPPSEEVKKEIRSSANVKHVDGSVVDMTTIKIPFKGKDWYYVIIVPPASRLIDAAGHGRLAIIKAHIVWGDNEIWQDGRVWNSLTAAINTFASGPEFEVLGF